MNPLIYLVLGTIAYLLADKLESVNNARYKDAEKCDDVYRDCPVCSRANCQGADDCRMDRSGGVAPEKVKETVPVVKRKRLKERERNQNRNPNPAPATESVTDDSQKAEQKAEQEQVQENEHSVFRDDGEESHDSDGTEFGDDYTG